MKHNFILITLFCLLFVPSAMGNSYAPFNQSFQYPIKNPDFENATWNESWNISPYSGQFYATVGSGLYVANGSKSAGTYTTVNVPEGSLVFYNQTINFTNLKNLTVGYYQDAAIANIVSWEISFNGVILNTTSTAHDTWTYVKLENNQSGVGVLSIKVINNYNGGWGETVAASIDNLTGYYSISSTPTPTPTPTPTYNYSGKFNITDISTACHIVNNSFVGSCTFVYGTDYIILLLTIIAVCLMILVLDRLARRILKKI